MSGPLFVEFILIAAFLCVACWPCEPRPRRPRRFPWLTRKGGRR